jgi:uncharacterized protein YdaU (DUF1376 family)
MTKNTFESPWWYRHVPRDFMSSPDVQIMTAEECGSYFFLLQNAWLGGADCTLPNDPERLARLARVEIVSELVLSKFQKDKDGRLYNGRLLGEWHDAVKRSKDATKAANKSHAVGLRSQSGRTAGALPTHCKGTATNTNTKTNTNTHKTKTKQAQVVAIDSEASTSAPSEPAVRVAARLTEILKRDNLKPATQNAWAELAERILTNNTEQDVLAVMQWALVDSDNMFWRGRVYSMKNFANSFGTIRQQYGMKDAGKREADPLAKRAASISTGHDFTAIAKGDL